MFAVEIHTKSWYMQSFVWMRILPLFLSLGPGPSALVAALSAFGLATEIYIWYFHTHNVGWHAYWSMHCANILGF